MTIVCGTWVGVLCALDDELDDDPALDEDDDPGVFVGVGVFVAVGMIVGVASPAMVGCSGGSYGVGANAGESAACNGVGPHAVNSNSIIVPRKMIRLMYPLLPSQVA